MTTIIDALMFGEGSFVTLAFFFILVFVAVKIQKYTAVLMLPLSVLLGLEYFAHDLGWHGLIAIVGSILVVLITVVGDKT